MTTVVDASALLAFLQGEAGSEVVEAHLVTGATCGVANWSEVAQKVRAAERDWALASALLHSYGLTIEAVTIDDAESAARLWRAGEGLSLADRLCLALGGRLDAPMVTADSAWGTDGSIQQIR